MTDGDPNISDILDSVLNGMGEEELVFDGPEASTPPAEAVPPRDAAKAEAGTTKARRAPRGGKSAKKTADKVDAIVEGPAPAAATSPISDTDMAEFEAMAAQLSADAAPAATVEEPAGAPAPFPPRGVEPAGSMTRPAMAPAPNSRLLLAIVALALFTSLLSLGGLIAVGRTLAHAGVAREEAIAERDALRRVPQLVQHLDDASTRLNAAAARLAAASPNGPPASAADVQRQLDALRLALNARQPTGVGALNDTTRDGFSEIATRLDRIQAQLDRAPAH